MLCLCVVDGIGGVYGAWDKGGRWGFSVLL